MTTVQQYQYQYRINYFNRLKLYYEIEYNDDNYTPEELETMRTDLRIAYSMEQLYIDKIIQLRENLSDTEKI